MSYTVLMSVYAKEQPAYLKQAVDSIAAQTLPPRQLVLVCDGPLTPELEEVIAGCAALFPASFDLVRLTENQGLGPALNEGLAYCTSNIVVRMDSDDIAKPLRCEKQLSFMEQNRLDLCSAAIEEFTGNLQITCKRSLPLTHTGLIAFAKKRNPMNHPCVAFRKSAVQRAGGYRHMPFFEDYDLWVRMIAQGAKLGNLEESLLYMRAGSELYRRRAGFAYCGAILRFWRSARREGFVSPARAFCNCLVRCGVSLVPNRLRELVYKKGLRSN